ncbi:hypothetical protein BU15DRAFT_67116 [Melanogaster broomeanus]|nr:hypothetical protein BU15DRAFT_67116 [Melanogaster broomeanus]
MTGERNELADEEAKKVAKDPHQTSTLKRLPIFLQRNPLPLSVSATKQAQRDVTKKRWARFWAKSPRYPHAHNIDKKMLAGSFVKLSLSIPRRHTSLLVWLRTKHCSLNAHLWKITKSDTPDCPTAQESTKTSYTSYFPALITRVNATNYPDNYAGKPQTYPSCCQIAKAFTHY